MLSPPQHERFERQLIMPEITEAGQAKLLEADIFIAGIGGLGSISAYYLTAAGVGRLRLVDNDRVTLSNLNRQILHNTSNLGQWKTISAAEKLKALNPDCRLETISETITLDNAVNLVQGCDLIIDATDNMPARQALNRASIALRIPFIYGGIHGFTGMASFFKPKITACFECIFQISPKQHAAPVPVIGPTAGLTASLQCTEAIKYILGMEPALMDRLLRFDGRDMTFKNTHLNKNMDCPACGRGGNPNDL